MGDKIKLVDYFRDKGAAPDNCPHCVIGRTLGDIGVYWCRKREGDIDGPYPLPFAGAEPCNLDDWGRCPLNPDREVKNA